MSFISNVQYRVSQIGNVIKRTYGPLAALDVSATLEDSIYRYPLDVGDSNLFPHTVEFQTWIPDPAPVPEALSTGLESVMNQVLGGAAAANKSEIPTGTTEMTADGRIVESMRVNTNQQYNPRLLDYTRRAKPSDLLVMYLPAGSWNDQIQNQYTEASMTAALGNLGLGIEAGSAFMNAYKSTDGGFFDRTWAGMKAVGASPMGAEATMRVIGGAMQNVGIVGDAGQLTDIALNSLGYAVNPQLEMLYGGTSMREFQFDFTMTPRSKKEAEEVMSIIKKLKYHASPQFTPENHGRYIIPPSFFDITFRFNGKQSEYLPRISTCALRAVDINYAGGLDTWATFEDGMPIQIQMILRFVELEMMHKRLRAEGY